nr:MAG TPA: hypothetical protein [Caudoviricetes sp.]
MHINKIFGGFLAESWRFLSIFRCYYGSVER